MNEADSNGLIFAMFSDMVFEFQMRVKNNAKISRVCFEIGEKWANILENAFSSIFRANDEKLSFVRIELK